MRDWINANETIRGDDHETIMAAIRLSCEKGFRKVVIPRYNARTKETRWSLMHAVELPGDFTLILDNCYMEQALGSYDNLITNERSHDLAYSNLWENEAHNITVLGEGNVTLSGGEHNHLLEKTTRHYGLGSMWQQPILYWHNVNGLRVENLHLEHFRWWSMLHSMTSNVVLRNLDFYVIPHVPNLDGIDLRIGCHDFFIENVTGRTGDDVLALTGLAGNGERERAVGGKDTNIRNVKVRNIKADSNFCYIVRLLNHDGCQEFNIDMDVIMDSSDPSSTVRGHGAVAIGSPFYAGKVLGTLGDTRKIRFSNVYSRGDAALALNHTLQDSCFTNVHTFDDCPALISGFQEGCVYDRVRVEYAYYEHSYPDYENDEDVPDEEVIGTLVTVPKMTGDLTLRDVETGPVRTLLSAPEGTGTVKIEGLRAERVTGNDEVGPDVTFVKEG